MRRSQLVKNLDEATSLFAEIPNKKNYDAWASAFDARFNHDLKLCQHHNCGTNLFYLNDEQKDIDI